MIYGLGTMHGSYFANRVNRVILLAPCLYGEGSYEILVNDFLGIYQAGVYYIGGNNWNKSLEKICSRLGEDTCALYSSFPEGMPPIPFKSAYAFMMNYVEERF